MTLKIVTCDIQVGHELSGHQSLEHEVFPGKNVVALLCSLMWWPSPLDLLVPSHDLLSTRMAQTWTHSSLTGHTVGREWQ